MRVSKKKRTEGKKQLSIPKPQQTNLEIRQIDPITDTQISAYDAYEDESNLFLHGWAGTGKTFISLYLALTSVFNRDYRKVYIVRSAVPTRDVGFLPGNLAEKAAVYEAPYVSVCTELFNRGDAYEILKRRDYVEFVTTSFVRGITLDNCVVFVDEIQNMSGHELDSIITRAGKNCRFIFSGDVTQSDFTRNSEKDGLKWFMKIIKRMHCFEFIEFKLSDVVRSDMVKDYLIAKDEIQTSSPPQS